MSESIAKIVTTEKQTFILTEQALPNDLAMVDILPFLNRISKMYANDLVGVEIGLAIKLISAHYTTIKKLISEPRSTRLDTPEDDAILAAAADEEDKYND